MCNIVILKLVPRLSQSKLLCSKWHFSKVTVLTFISLGYTVEVRLVDAPPMWTSTCCGHCFHGPFIVRIVQKVSTTVDCSPLWTLFARPSSVHIRGPPLYLGHSLFYWGLHVQGFCHVTGMEFVEIFEIFFFFMDPLQVLLCTLTDCMNLRTHVVTSSFKHTS